MHTLNHSTYCFVLLYLFYSFCIIAVDGTMFKHISREKLYVSEPDPRMFGNGRNEQLPTWSNGNWLKSRFHFSFAEYHSPHNQNYGVLRVMNDDLVQPSRGFGEHPHRDMEICTYIVSGNLTHQDSMGTAETLTRGAIQFMTAGTGVYHSEHNKNPESPLRFIQMWINPRRRGLQPNYGSGVTDVEARHNKFAHLVSDVQNKAVSTPIKINQDANIHVSEFDLGKTVEFSVEEGRQAYVLCVEGSGVQVSGSGKFLTSMEKHDAGEASGPVSLQFTSNESSGGHVLIVEMNKESGAGRTDL